MVGFRELPPGFQGDTKHNWGAPMPGGGPMPVCKACGQKQTNLTLTAECIGRPAVGLVDTHHDYDPTS